MKARVGGVIDDPADYALPHWAGVVPLRLRPGLARARRRRTGPVPAYLQPAAAALAHRARRCAATTSSSSRSTCPMWTGLFAAIADDEVYRWLSRRPRPTTVAEMAARGARGAAHATSRASGCRSCSSAPAPARSSARRRTTPSTRSTGAIAIGYTMLGRAALAHRRQHRGEAAAAGARLRHASARCGWSGTPTAQRALAAGHRAARRHPRGRAAPAPACAPTAPGATRACTR